MDGFAVCMEVDLTRLTIELDKETLLIFGLSNWVGGLTIYLWREEWKKI